MEALKLAGMIGAIIFAFWIYYWGLMVRTAGAW